MDVEGAELPAVGEFYLAGAGEVVGDLPDGSDRVFQREIPEDDIPFDHLQESHHRSHFHEGGVLAHVRVAGDHVEPAVALGVGVGLVAGVDDRA